MQEAADGKDDEEEQELQEGDEDVFHLYREPLAERSLLLQDATWRGEIQTVESGAFARREANVVLLWLWKESVWAEFSEVVQIV